MLFGWPPHTVEPGDVVLVWGASGGLGSLAVQLVANAGGRAVAVVSSEEKGEYAKQLGAAGYINRKDFSHWGVPPTWDSPEWKDWFGGAKAFGKAIWDVLGEKASPRIVFDHPGEDTIPTSIFVADRGGMVVICAGTSGFDTMVDVRYLWTMQKRYQGSHLFNDEQAAAFNQLVIDGKVTHDARLGLPVRAGRARASADGRRRAARGQRERADQRPDRGPDRPALTRARVAALTRVGSCTSSTSTPLHRARVHERDRGAARPRPGRLVDQLGALGPQVLERRLDVGDPVRDVVQARASRGERPSDRRLGAERAQQLHVRRADGEQHLLDALILDPLAVHRLDAEQPPVALDGGLEVIDGDAHVVDVGELERHRRSGGERRLHAGDQIVGLGDVVGRQREGPRHGGDAQRAQVGLRPSCRSAGEGAAPST